MLYLIGIGLSDEKDITVKGLEAIRQCDIVYLESYTSKLQVGVDKLEEFYGKKVVAIDRNFVEDGSGIIEKSKETNVALLVVGDVFGATTHMGLILRLKKESIGYEIIHNASILTVVGETGLELYKFGRVASIPFENSNIESPYDVLKENGDLHTLFLLDLDTKKNKFMRFDEAIEYLLRIEGKRKEGIFDDNKLCVVCCGLGSKKQVIKARGFDDLLKEKIDIFPQCLIVPGKLHFVEEEMLEIFK